MALFLILVTSCRLYIPSSSEIAAKEKTLKEVKSLINDLKLIPDMVLKKYPGAPFDDILFHGNYIAKKSQAEARFLTDMPGQQACKVFLEYLKKNNAWDLKSNHGECEIKKIHDFLSSGINARKNTGFNIGIDIKEYIDSKTQNNFKRKTEIYIHISRSLSTGKSLECIVEKPPEEQPCVNALWYEKR